MPAEASVVSDVAQRYAAALFDLAREGRTLDATAADLQRLQAMVASSPDLARLVRSPMFRRQQQQAAMAAVLAGAGIAGHVANLVGVLVRNRRLFALADIARAFRRLLSEHRGELPAHVTSAHPLSERQVQAIRAELTASTKREVSVETAVDPSLLGGLLVKIGSRMIDSSLSGKLQRLRVAMKGAR
ncbi:MAG: F0F1 ATP synthase subunit delta [Alphaproteobacteria bacterium]|nr:F0F1 ATP synthase subunit delta [Alphaproteobacteria bacterium]